MRVLIGVVLGLTGLSASAASFIPLGDLAGGGFSSSALNVSADGSVVVDVASSASGTDAFVWTSGSGWQRLFVE